MSAPQTEVLVFVDGREIARHILGPGAHSFGASNGCNIRIEADLVSPRHAQLTIGEDGALLLEDLGSANGTYLDGQRIAAPTSVTPNQIIQIGAAQILILQSTAGASDESTVAADGIVAAAPSEFSQTVRYEIGAEIAKGGMGAVLTARQPAIRREVALKVMLRNVSAHDRLRFIEEAQITGQLEHPNIVPVHDLALNEQGQPYYTMKLVKGSTLKEILALLLQGDALAVARHPLAGLLTIFQKVCDAVAFAHARGVIHRDLKPANIMVGEYGEVLVMDWGLAKIITGRNGSSDQPSATVVGTARDDQREVFATLDGAVMGTPQYMSPEQARGEVASLDQRSDIFSLGSILYELVTLLPPFPGKTTREILSNIISGHFILPNARLRTTDAPHPRHLPAGVIPDSLEAVISKALAFDHEQRYQSVTAFQSDLTAYQGGFATGAENAGAWKQLTLLVKRHKALFIAVATSLLLLASVSAAFTLRVLHERDTAVRERTKAVEANAENLRHLHEASMADYAAAVQRIDNDNRWGEGVNHLARALDLEPKNNFAAGRLYGTIAFDALDKADLLRSVLRHEDFVSSASFSPDGTRIVTASDDKTARLWDAATGKPFGEPMRHKDKVTSASFSPDGTRIVTVSDDNTARLWDAATGKPLGEPMRHENRVTSVIFSPDGTRIVTASDDNTARLWDAATGKPLGEPLGHEDVVSSASFSPDGTRIVTVSADKTARLWDAATGKPLGEPLRHEDGVDSASFSPDGTRIVTVSDDNTARLWDAATGKPLGEPLGHKDKVTSVIFSPDAQILTVSNDNSVRVWDAATGKPLGEPMRHEDKVTSAGFSPDGTRIVTVSDDNSARVWDAATGKPLGEPLRHEDGVDSASFSPDGTRIVTVGYDNSARVWDAATGKPLGEPLRHEDGVDSASFSPDGARIVTTSDDNSARVWDATTGKPLSEPLRHKAWATKANFNPDGTRIVISSDDDTTRLWDATTGEPLGEPLGRAYLVTSFSPDGMRIVAASDDNSARVWDAATGKPLGEPLRHEGAVEGASFSPDGTRIVTASDDKTARLWDPATGKPLGEPLRHEGKVRSASFSPNGSRIVTVCADSTAWLWDAATGKPLGAPMRHEGNVYSASFSPDSTRILTVTDDNTTRLWDAATGKPLGKPTHYADSVFDTSFSPDARILTAIGDKIVRVWDAATGKPLGEPMQHKQALAWAMFSPNGTRILTASIDHTEQLWDAAIGKPLGEPMGRMGKAPGESMPETPVASASFSPDGTHIVTLVGEDNTARLLDAATGKPIGEPLRHEGPVYRAIFSPDGTRVFTACEDHTARVWDVKSLLNLPSPTPEWVCVWARAIAGLRFDTSGVMQPMPAEERLKILNAPHAGDDPWSRLARWVATDPARRTITPDSTHTCRETAERERDFGAKESLESALRYDPTVPLARLMLAKFEENPQRAAFLRDYDLKRLPDDPALCDRAVRALHDQMDDERARQALQKLEKLAPEKAAALRKELGL